MTAGVTRLWDCIVIGAGPAGAIAAGHLAACGHEVLLVDRSSFPRYKVCGCCINGVAQDALVEAGLGSLLGHEEAVPLRELILFDGDKTASVELSSGVSLSRESFDFALIKAAIERGSQFLPDRQARVVAKEEPEFRSIQLLDSNSKCETARAKIVLVADGLSGRSLDMCQEFRPVLDGNSRFGAGVGLAVGPDFYEPGKIYMACGPGGYVGLVRLEDNRLDVAAAFDPDFSRHSGGPTQAAVNVLARCGLPVPADLAEAHWTGTQQLTRRRKTVAGHRLLIAGDACGYPEPFTGEGIAWALQSGLGAAKLASAAINEWHPGLSCKWQKSHENLRAQHSRSALLALLLRNSATRRIVIQSISLFPSLASRVVRQISGTRSAA